MLEFARNLLESGGYTCVLTDGVTTYTSTLRGVKPLVQFVEMKEIPEGLIASDKVVGKATAYLYVLLNIRALYAKVISESAVAVLQQNGISVQYESLVPHIINRSGDGICPFEEAVMEISDARAAYAEILKKMNDLQIPIWDA